MRTSDVRTLDRVDGIVLLTGRVPERWDDWCDENTIGQWHRTTKVSEVMLGSALSVSHIYSHAYAFEHEQDHILFKLRWTQ